MRPTAATATPTPARRSASEGMRATEAARTPLTANPPGYWYESRRILVKLWLVPLTL